MRFRKHDYDLKLCEVDWVQFHFDIILLDVNLIKCYDLYIYIYIFTMSKINITYIDFVRTIVFLYLSI